MSVEQLFSGYGQALSAHQIDKMADFYSIPSMDICADTKRVIQDATSLKAYIMDLISDLNVPADSEVDFDILTNIALADSMRFCILRWSWVDEQGTKQMTKPMSYTVKSDRETQQILATVRE